MKKITILLFAFLPTCLFAQKWEFGGYGGMTVYSGELATEFIASQEIHPAFGGLVRYNFNKHLTLKTNIYYGTLSGDDANADKREQVVRNLSFETSILDIGAQAEFNFMGFNTTKERFRTSLYGLIGASVFRFNPRTRYNGRWVELQPIGTEGQGTTKFNERDKYALTQISIPFGIGLKHAFNEHWSFGLELGLRKTFTDYIDDVSTTYVAPELLRATHGQISAELSNRTDEVLDEGRDYDSRDSRGDPTVSDWYHFAGITFTYTIVPGNCYSF